MVTLIPLARKMSGYLRHKKRVFRVIKATNWMFIDRIRILPTQHTYALEHYYYYWKNNN